MPEPKVEPEQFFEPSALVLLDDEQWLSLQRRYHMTPRELEVSKLVCRGLSNRQIATALKITQGTVKTHLRNIYRRVRVNSKVVLLLRFIEDTTASANEPKPLFQARRTPKTQRRLKFSSRHLKTE